MPVISTKSEFSSFREHLYRQFEHRANSVMDLLDALCSNDHASSVVELSLNPLFRGGYSALFKAIGEYQLPPLGEPSESFLKKERSSFLRLLSSVVPVPEQQDFFLFGLDCTSIERGYAQTLSDRGMVYQPTVVSTNTPVTIGHSYSMLASLPERTSTDAPWTIPLDMSRVSTDTSSAQVGVTQVHALLKTPHLPWSGKLCVLDVDSGYSNKNFLEPLQTHKCLVTIARCRSNRVFYQSPVPSDAPSKRGHPVWYGERFALKDEATWPEPDTLIDTIEITQKGRLLNVTITAWHNMLMRGSKPHPMHKHPFTLLRIERVEERGKMVGSPMWLIIIGEQRHQLSPLQAYQAYRHRFDLEHTFRVQKRNLLLDAFQTPDSEHEQHWVQLVMLAYVQLWNAHLLAQTMPRPWEHTLKTEPTARISPSNVQRDWHRIISQLGSPATAAKPRGKSPGRQLGQTQTPRPRFPVIKKRQAKNTDEKKVA